LLGTYRNYDGYLPTHKIGREPRQSIVLTLSPTIIDGDVSTLNEAGLIQTLPDHGDRMRVGVGRTAAEKSNYRQRRLLPARRERPAEYSTAEKGDELTPLHLLPHA